MRDVGDGDGEDVPAGIVRIGIRRGMHRIVVVLGVDRIDGDEFELSPILAAGEIGGPRRMSLGLDGNRKHMRDVVGVDGDEAHRAFALDRAEPFLDARDRQTETAVLRDADGDQVAVLGVLGGLARDRKLLAELLLVDRDEPAAAVRQSPENAERADLGLVDDLDDAAGIADAVLTGFFDPEQRPVADAGDFARPWPAPCCDPDSRYRAVGVLVPFGRRGDQLAVVVAAGDVGQRDLGQGAGMVQLLALGLDAAFVGELAQHALQLDAAVVLQIEGAGDLARADLAGLLGDKGEDFFLAGEGDLLGMMFDQ